MARPPTAFDSAQFALIPDTHERKYGSCSNVLVFEDERGRVKEYPVIIPTDLFTIMRQILKIEPTDEAFLYINQQDEWYVFGIAWSVHEFTDLWLYSEASLPKFIDR